LVAFICAALLVLVGVGLFFVVRRARKNKKKKKKPSDVETARATSGKAEAKEPKVLVLRAKTRRAAERTAAAEICGAEAAADRREEAVERGRLGEEGRRLLRSVQLQHPQDQSAFG